MTRKLSQLIVLNMIACHVDVHFCNFYKIFFLLLSALLLFTSSMTARSGQLKP